MADVLTIDGVLDDETCLALVQQLATAATEDAPVYGRGAAATVDRGARSTTRVLAPEAAHNAVRAAILGHTAQLEGAFGVPLGELEPLQFLRYTAGDYFVAHQDGNTPLIHDHTRFRCLSIVMFLSTPDSYRGGELVMHGAYPDYERRTALPASRGRMVAFRPETTHEVTPVTAGERYTVASWFRRPAR